MPEDLDELEIGVPIYRRVTCAIGSFLKIDGIDP